MLAVATVGFAVNFWAWALISPLGAFFAGRLRPVSAVEKSLLVAVPVVVGSLGRIPVGALTDRFGAPGDVPAGHRADHRAGARSSATSGSDSYAMMLARRFRPRPRRHDVRHRRPAGQRLVPAGEARDRARHLRGRHGRHRDLGIHHRVAEGRVRPVAFPFTLVAVAARRLRASLVLRVLATRPAGRADRQPARRRRRRLKLPVTWQLSFLYAVGFGGFVAFSVYLPTYLKTAFGLTAR